MAVGSGRQSYHYTPPPPLQPRRTPSFLSFWGIAILKKEKALPERRARVGLRDRIMVSRVRRGRSGARVAVVAVAAGVPLTPLAPSSPRVAVGAAGAGAGGCSQ